MNNLVLLADKKSNSWDFAEKIQRYLLEEKKELIPLYEVNIETFNNGEIKVNVPKSVRRKDVYFIHDSAKDPQRWWVELLLIKDLLLSSSVNSLSFVLPDMFYSRQDRKDRPHVPISARALARTISPGIKRIITMDLHANQIQGFYPETLPLDNLYSFPEVVLYLNKFHQEDLDNLVIVSPDAGSVGRTKLFLRSLINSQENSDLKRDYFYALLSKERSKPGEIEAVQLIGDVSGKNILIIDDIIDTGGTLIKVAETLKSNGAKKLMCYGTHGIFTNGTEKIHEKFDLIMTSNTHNNKKDYVEVIDISRIFAEAIYRAQKGLSISELFE